MAGAGNERGAVDADSSGIFEQFEQAEPLENGGTIAADEFATNAMARIAAGFAKNGGNPALTQADAQREAREPASHDRDASGRSHASILSARDKEVAEQTGAALG
jgi:hypothetical protein